MSGTTPDWDRARELIAQGHSCTATAKELGVAKSTVSKWASKEGIEFDRSQTAQATVASQIDRKARRAKIIDRLYDETDAALDRLRDQPDMQPRDVRDLSVALNNYLERATRLETVDGDPGIAGAESMLGRLAARLRINEPQEPEGA